MNTASGRPTRSAGVGGPRPAQVRGLEGDSATFLVISQRRRGSQTRSLLWRGSGSSMTLVRDFSARLWLTDFDGGRALLSGSDGRVLMVDVRGAVLASFFFTPLPKSLRLAWPFVIAQQGDRIVAYRGKQGRLARVWRATDGGKLQLLDARSGIVVWRTRRSLHVSALASAREEIIEVPGRGRISAAIGSEHLFYAYNTEPPRPGRVAALPLTSLVP
jgi:hypothetical protein